MVSDPAHQMRKLHILFKLRRINMINRLDHFVLTVKRTGALGPILSVYIRDPDNNLIELSRYLD